MLNPQAGWIKHSQWLSCQVKSARKALVPHVRNSTEGWQDGWVSDNRPWTLASKLKFHPQNPHDGRREPTSQVIPWPTHLSQSHEQQQQQQQKALTNVNCVYLRQGLCLCSPGCPELLLHRSLCLCPPSADIKGVHHHHSVDMPILWLQSSGRFQG